MRPKLGPKTHQNRQPSLWTWCCWLIGAYEKGRRLDDYVGEGVVDEDKRKKASGRGKGKSSISWRWEDNDLAAEYR